MNKTNTNLYELRQSDDENYRLLCLYGQPGETGKPPAGGLSREVFDGFARRDETGSWIVAHSPLPQYVAIE